MTRLTTKFVFVAALLATSPAFAFLDGDDLDFEAPDEDYVWVDAVTLADGSEAPGFYRVRSRAGYAWEAGYWDGGVYVAGGWRALEPRRGHVYVPGHVGEDGYWVDGHWRPTRRPGYAWVDSEWNDGAYIHGYWRPVHARAGHVWVGGYWAPGGVWVEGYWRPRSRAGYRWSGGRYRYGHWHHAHWTPVRSRPNHLWVAGAFVAGAWVAGYWRPHHRAGHHWRDGRWRGGHYVRGGWHRGHRSHHVRHHPRPRHVRHASRGRHRDRPHTRRGGRDTYRPTGRARHQSRQRPRRGSEHRSRKPRTEQRRPRAGHGARGQSRTQRHGTAHRQQRRPQTHRGQGRPNTERRQSRPHMKRQTKRPNTRRLHERPSTSRPHRVERRGAQRGRPHQRARSEGARQHHGNLHRPTD